MHCEDITNLELSCINYVNKSVSVLVISVSQTSVLKIRRDWKTKTNKYTKHQFKTRSTYKTHCFKDITSIHIHLHINLLWQRKRTKWTMKFYTLFSMLYRNLQKDTCDTFALTPVAIALCHLVLQTQNTYLTITYLMVIHFSIDRLKNGLQIWCIFQVNGCMVMTECVTACLSRVCSASTFELSNEWIHAQQWSVKFLNGPSTVQRYHMIGLFTKE